MLQPSFFHEQFRQLLGRRPHCCPDPGLAAVEAGHPQLLGWLLRHCPGLLDTQRVFEAAAKHSSLAGLQLAWAVLKFGASGVSMQRLLDLAAQSTSSDAVAKMEWLLQAGHLRRKLGKSTAVAASRSGDVGRLR